ncbi:hypothetical protein EDD18DRAFT_568738 [Armillaria luteobubalina]|uniref:DUF6533 domain-containing protein n=1 Tax=Armillaria luteobubalina TaxID=153913 RepID=A0AA39PU05_9AGAR|nr:hypothetical protein EDD18DRAFT_568738 [Armillaria luteobubalina]
MSLTTSPNSFSTYSFIASITVLLYDLLLLLPTEMDYVWLPRPVHPLLLLFTLNRYLPLIDAAMTIHWILHESSAAQCRLLSFITTPLAAVCIFASQVILMVRTYAIWDRHRGDILVFYRDRNLLFYTGGNRPWLPSQDNSIRRTVQPS